MSELIGILGQVEWASIMVSKELKLKFHEAVKQKHGFTHGAVGFEIERAMNAHILIMNEETK